MLCKFFIRESRFHAPTLQSLHAPLLFDGQFFVHCVQVFHPEHILILNLFFIRHMFFHSWHVFFSFWRQFSFWIGFSFWTCLNILYMFCFVAANLLPVLYSLLFEGQLFSSACKFFILHRFFILNRYFFVGMFFSFWAGLYIVHDEKNVCRNKLKTCRE